MFAYFKGAHKLATQFAVALVLLPWLIDIAEATAKCHKCSGVNCQRTSYSATEECLDTLDTCVTIIQGSTVVAQGCLGQLAEELRGKCMTPSTADGGERVAEFDAPQVLRTSSCYQCNEELCNNVGGIGLECIQCDSNADSDCASNTKNLTPGRCPISRAMNSYCYAKVEGKRAVRGCATDLAQQRECLNTNDCTLCSPLEISGCNRDPRVYTDSGSDTGSGDGDSGSGDGGSGSESGGSGNGGSGSGSGGGGSGSGSGGSGTGSGGGGSGSGSDGSSSGSGGGGTGSGGGGTGSGGGGSDNGGAGSGSGGGDSGSENGGSGSGGTGSGGGGSNGGSGSGSSSGGSGSGSGGSGGGSGSGSGDGGSGSGGAGSDNGGSGSGDGGSGSGSGSDDNGSGSENNHNYGAIADLNFKVFTIAMVILLAHLTSY